MFSHGKGTSLQPSVLLFQGMGFLNINGFNPTYTAGLALKNAKGRSGFLQVPDIYNGSRKPVSIYIYKSVCIKEVETLYIYIEYIGI